MDKKTIAITDCDHDDISIEEEVLREGGFEAPWFNCKNEDDLIANCKGFQALINQYAPFTRRVFEELTDLKMIVRYGVGVDNIDLEAASEYGVSVCNVPDYGMYEVADQAMALMLALTRKIISSNEEVRSGVWDYTRSIPIYRLSEQKVGVIGAGRIGTAFAERAHAFGLEVLVYDESARKRGSLKDFMTPVSLEELLRESDIISIHCPLDNNRDLISLEELKMMKESAYLINVSRGGIINEDDLLYALENELIAGAACDVFTKEPIDSQSPLLKLDNFISTPHIAWYSEESSRELARKVAEEAVRAGKGQELINVVNR